MIEKRKLKLKYFRLHVIPWIEKVESQGGWIYDVTDVNLLIHYWINYSGRSEYAYDGFPINYQMFIMFQELKWIYAFYLYRGRYPIKAEIGKTVSRDNRSAYNVRVAFPVWVEQMKNKWKLLKKYENNNNLF